MKIQIFKYGPYLLAAMLLAVNALGAVNAGHVNKDMNMLNKPLLELAMPVDSGPSTNIGYITMASATAGNVYVDGSLINLVSSGSSATIATNAAAFIIAGNLNNGAGAVINHGTAAITVNGSYTGSTAVPMNTFANSGTYNQTTGTLTTGAVYNKASGILNLGTVGGDLVINKNGAAVGGSNYAYYNLGTYTQSTATTYFSGTSSQNLFDNSAAGTKFKLVTFNGGNTVIMLNGASVAAPGNPAKNFMVDPAGILTLANNGSNATTLAAGSSTIYYLTLLSTATSTASVAAVGRGSKFTGSANAQRYINGGVGHRGYHLESSPVHEGTDSYGNLIYSVNYLTTSTYTSGTNGTSGGFSKTGNPSIYFYRESLGAAYKKSNFTTTAYRAVSDMSADPYYTLDVDGSGWNITAGNGFFNFYRGGLTTPSPYNQATPPDPVTLAAIGTPNTGTINVVNWYNPSSTTLSYTTTSPAAVVGFQMLGNPYPCTINFEKFNRNGTNSSIYGNGFTTPATIYFFNPLTKQYSSYMQKTTISSVADTTTSINPGISSDGYASNMIASGQGFFIRTTATGQTFSFRETAKTTTQPAAAGLAKLMGLPKTFTEQPEPLMRLRLIKDSLNTDEVVLAFNNQDSTAYSNDKDALDLGGNGALESLSLLSSDKVLLSIHRRRLPNQKGQVIPLLVDGATTGIYQLKKIQFDYLPQLYDVWLVDAYKKDSLDIRANDTYSFNIDKKDTTTFGSKRFKLVIRQNPDYAYRLLDFSATKAPGAASQVQLAWVTENEQDYTNFSVEKSIDGGKTFDAIGEKWGSAAGTYSLLDKYPVIGTNLYRLKQIDVNNIVTYSKIIPVEYAPLSNRIVGGLDIYPNPVKNTINLEVLVKPVKSVTYGIKVMNSLGIVVKNATSSDTTWQGSASDLLPGTYMVKVINNQDNSLVGVTKFVKL